MALNFPLNPSDGDTYEGYVYDATAGVWNANQGQIISRFSTSATQPNSPTAGDGWLNPANGKTYVYYDGYWIESGNPVIGGVEPYDKRTTATGYFSLPTGTTAQRPDTPQNGDIRFNTTLGEPEWYSEAELGWFLFKDGIPDPLTVQYLVIAGGGGAGGGEGNSVGGGGGGGGAGGYRINRTGESSGGGASAETEFIAEKNINYTITIGSGGAGGAGSSGGAGGAGSQGGNSVFSTITSVGGGGGGTDGDTAGDGGSGGGVGGDGGPAGTGTPDQGFDGGPSPGNRRGGGGGGAAELGGSDVNSSYGGDGVTSSISGSTVTRAGGGGGGAGGDVSVGDNRGTGGGGRGADSNNNNNTGGIANTGGGGGAGAAIDGTGGPGASGGSGIVILRYPSENNLIVGAGLTSTTQQISSEKVTIFTAGTDTVYFV